MKTILITALAVAISTSGLLAQNSGLQYYTPNNKTGINQFETSKEDTAVFDGLNVKLGGAFTLDFQRLEHTNSAVPNIVEGKNQNELREIGGGFNLASANLNIDVQFAEGIRMHLATYLASRHHNEAWVKGGYIQMDRLPMLNVAALDRIMDFVTIKVGHMEINYGDAHFRRSDNGQTMHNAFVENYIIDAFTTEVGGEIYFQHSGFLAMGGITGGEIKGDVTRPDDRKPAFLGKLGYDNEVMDNIRLRLTGSIYTTEGSVSNTLLGGDRAGSRYWMVMVNDATTNNFSGRFNPGMRDKITAMVINPFIKIHGLELFGNIEQFKGRAANEDDERTWNQLGVDLVYRIGQNENFYVAGRYNTVNGTMAGATPVDVSIERIAASLGWFVTDNILAKVEYVTQEYKDYPEKNIFHGGKFNGLLVSGAISF